MSAEITNPDAPATGKQIEYLRALVGKHDVGMDEETFKALLKTWIDNGIATRAFISGFIDQYLQMPLRPGVPTYTAKPPAGAAPVRPAYYKTPKRTPPIEVDLGFYVVKSASLLTEAYYHVVKTRDGQRTYAKVLTNEGGTWRWEYEPGAIREAAAGSKISIAHAATWSRWHKACFICGKDHSDDGWKWPTRCHNSLSAHNT